MNRLLLSVIFVAALPGVLWGAIVYSGSQNVVLQLSPMNPMASATIDIARSGQKWDSFQVNLWLEMTTMSMPGMTPSMGMPGMMTMMNMVTRLAIFAPGAMMTSPMPGGMGMGMSMGMGMGGILAPRSLAANLTMGAMVGPSAPFLDWAYLRDSGGIEDEGGYVGFVTPDGHYGWLHMLGQSGIDTQNHGVVFDGWAYEDRPGVPVGAGEGPCDWLPGGPYKMHWPQAPDLSAAGMDVSGMGTVLADDFKCTATGPISRIHFWASFAQDVLPARGAGAINFEISIYSDVPAQQNTPSRPGQLLWTRTFMSGQYTVRTVHDGPEGWFDPLKDNSYEPANHRQAYQYDFCVGNDPFGQQEGTVYWLAVKVLEASNPTYRIGWKSTCPEYRWNDSAAYLAVDGSWRPLAYPARHDYASEALDLAFVIDSGRDLQAKYDLGDAPDRSNSLPGVPMTAYPKGGPLGIAANFPTVYQAGSPPYGPVHHDPTSKAFLGHGVTLENEADIGPDADPTNNLDPLADAPDADGLDDGVTVPLVLPDCRTTTFDYVVTVIDPSVTRFYVNVWLDWNRDGDWDDTVTCPDGTVVSEWAVQNQQPAVSRLGPVTLTTPSFTCWHPETEGDPDPLWMRITLSDSEWASGGTNLVGAGGAGPANGYRFGETEDYYFYPVRESTPPKYDWGDAPDGRTDAAYPTLSASDGARHVIAGPWLGDPTGVPDAESDGRPDFNALGDDNDGNDDEQGVTIPPLVQGEPTPVGVEVGGGGGVVQAWIDFNRDMVWQTGEQVFNGYLPDGSHTITVTVPYDAKAGQSYARFRISTKGGLTPQGLAPNGEVEDHEVAIRTTPPHVKRVQWPDLTENGIDIRVDGSDGKVRWLADDFKCTSVNRITEVHLWGSWKGDRKGKIQKIHLRIRSDDPTGPDGADQRNLFSKPGPEVLWSESFLPNEFEETLYHIVRHPGEWWWDPATEELIPGGDKEIWRVSISIDRLKAFLQQGSPATPILYWLEVRVETMDGEFGWKTRRWPDHYMDDAVWDAGVNSPGAWKELRYPKGHPYYAVEKNSIDMAFYLTYTAEIVEQPTTRPGSATQCPVVETQCPAVETRCPPVKTQCPTVKTQCPMTKTSCPTVSTQCPAVETRCPLVKTKCPTATTRCPMVTTKCPVTATRCQVVDTRCPSVETKCPVVATKCPEALTKCPPTATQCQVVTTQCPAVYTQCPESFTKCPPTATQCQVAATQCPAVYTQCPASATKCPVALTKCPPTATQCQVIQTQCPVVATQCPPSLTKCPPTATSCQTVDTQCPVVQTRCPPVDTRCPVAATKCPVAATQCPTMLTTCPPMDTRCPTESTKCPVVATQCPTTSTTCPPVDTRCPVEPTKCPVMTTQCPVALTKCPATSTVCQTVTTQCPPVETRCPPGPTRCPVAATQCPTTVTTCPPVDTRCPAEKTRCPVVATECPVSLTKCPSTITECQAVQTQCPTVATRCPIVGTRCPESSTKCPETSTKCPVVETQCPTVMTQCPPALTKCPATVTLCTPVTTQCPPALTRCPRCIPPSASVAAAIACPPIDVICPSVVTARR